MKPTRPKTPGRKPPPPPPPKPTPKSSNQIIRDPVEVYCRLRPLENDNEQLCIEPISSTTIRLTTPDNCIAARNGNLKELQYTFKFVFDENVSQKALFDHAALPLVDDLLHGKNGILFTYGVTGSGKTYTMTGTPQNGGIMPRCLDVVFNSIGDLQAEKYVFKPDKMNGFDVQTKADAMLDRQKDLNIITTPRTPRTPYRKEPEKAFERVPDITKIDSVEDDNVFGVFVSYVEIYNNYVYDLLDDTPIDPIKPKPPQSKILREDGQHNMYVHGCIEIEVKSTEEAFDVFYKGQKRKRMAHTQLNTESSRSHSVFTIRLVQAPLDPQGEEVFQEKSAICISQLSLVDLAGSERTLRTKNTGDRLREAGNINNSLMVLRTCMEILRENQMQNANKMVPYRDSKLTHLFKNYFDGEGKVRMIVCINPSISDYDETIHVMRFAELTQEVQVARPQTVKFDMGLTPGRRRANQIYKEAVERIVNEGGHLEDFPIVSVPVIYSLGPPFPNHELVLASDETILENLIEFLSARMKSRRTLVTDFQQKQNNFRNMLLNVERENALMKQQIIDLKAELETKDQKLNYNERRLQSAENANSILQRKLQEYQKTKRNLEFELDEKDMLINQKRLENDKIKAKMQDKLVSERGRITREMQRRMREKQAALEVEVMKKSEKLKAVRDIAMNENWAGPSGEHPLRTAPSTPNLTMNREPKSIEARIAKLQGSKSDPKLASIETTPYWTPPQTSVPVANPRHRRSRSGGEIWIEHRPPGSLMLDTILQPQIKKRKSVSKLDMKNITEDADRYCLVHQQQDDKGDIETQLYKGNVIPSAGGGAQVIFNDVEVLKQTSPPSATKKRSVDGVPRNSDGSSSEVTDVEDRCRLAVEGHRVGNGNKSKKQRR